MADKSFGVKELNIIGTGTPTIQSPNSGDLNITAAKVMHAKSNHKQVVNFISASIGKCQIGEELILKYSYSMATGELKYTDNKCPDILDGDAAEMQSAFWNHFSSLILSFSERTERLNSPFAHLLIASE